MQPMNHTNLSNSFVLNTEDIQHLVIMEESTKSYLKKELELIKANISYLDIIHLYSSFNKTQEPTVIEFPFTVKFKENPQNPILFIAPSIPYLPTTAEKHLKVLTIIKKQNDLIKEMKKMTEQLYEDKGIQDEKKPKKRITRKEKKEIIIKQNDDSGDQSNTIEDKISFNQLPNNDNILQKSQEGLNYYKSDNNLLSTIEEYESIENKKEDKIKEIEESEDNDKTEKEEGEWINKEPNKNPIVPEQPKEKKHQRKRKLRSAEERKPSMKFTMLEQEKEDLKKKIVKEKKREETSRNNGISQSTSIQPPLRIVQKSNESKKSLLEDHLRIVNKTIRSDKKDLSKIKSKDSSLNTQKTLEDRLKELPKRMPNPKQAYGDSGLISQITKFCTSSDTTSNAIRVTDQTPRKSITKPLLLNSLNTSSIDDIVSPNKGIDLNYSLIEQNDLLKKQEEHP
ncbi:hypothetical protein, conserved [Entamoeba dispar SAW760]|uniref:Uncharacterized protein n=1 Tax=Entamoeba dispar (strain ATCC PRA-260 / SAW760) TaxID=370354 RepID=B0EG22_ENTDS|nr:uncharacterized protein EDI_200270 [Entamoeba dispar SAW760]EDR26516.1 hypothetical protein, conserved [Entamoeba dispar SAW760]|eukprot:EDR26516.1 hypothetical protein, conserved [Entamoeba dispar SAW760]